MLKHVRVGPLPIVAYFSQGRRRYLALLRTVHALSFGAVLSGLTATTVRPHRSIGARFNWFSLMVFLEWRLWVLILGTNIQKFRIA